MKVILSGGTGLVGRELGKALVKEGYEVIALTRNPEKSLEKTPYPHKPIKWDGEKDVLDAQVFEGVDAVIHLAGVGIADERWTESFKKRLEDSRILATENLLKKAPKSLKVFVGASAIGYYPESDQPMREDHTVADNFFGQLCKRWEDSAYKCLDSKATRIAHIRTGVVLAPKGGALEQMITPLKTGLAGPLASGQQVMSWIDIEDIVGIYMHALKNDKAMGAINGVAPSPVTNKKLTQIIGKLICRPVLIPAPKFALRIVLGEVAKYLVMSQNVSAQKIMSLGYKFKFPTVEKSLEKNIGNAKSSKSDK